MDISNLKAFSRGFFQDILTVMIVLDLDNLSREDLEYLIVAKIKEQNKEVAKMHKARKVEITQDFTNMAVSKKYEIFKQKNPDSKMTIEAFIVELRAGRTPCKNCNDKEK